MITTEELDKKLALARKDGTHYFFVCAPTYSQDLIQQWSSKNHVPYDIIADPNLLVPEGFDLYEFHVRLHN